ncbi:hypothetical protein EDC04DRAFT_2527969, partial [Pisolithus marmoratus]
PLTSNSSIADMGCKIIYKCHVESEQMCHGEHWDGYCQLKNTLPVPDQKSSKVSL